MNPRDCVSDIKSSTDAIFRGGEPIAQEALDEIGNLVRRCNKDWKGKELTLAILTHINFPTDGLQTEKLSDYLIPYASEQLPQELQKDSELMQEFFHHQTRILSKPRINSSSRGISQDHYNIPDGSQLYKREGILEHADDRGRSVDQVSCIDTKGIFARKLLRKYQNSVEAIENEINVMKQIHHHHVVELVASYTDMSSFGLIIHPVANQNLRHFLLDDEQLEGIGRKAWLRTFFGCLARTLQYLHDLKIQHRDIKPENILVQKEEGKFVVIFCDFGISKDSDKEARSTTYNKHWGTDRYCAPELKREGEGHNEKMDIFSLACVYVEMWTVLNSKTLNEMESFMSAIASSAWTYHGNLGSVREWIEKVKNEEADSYEIEPTDWINKGLVEAYRKRPSAAEIFEEIRESYNKSEESVRTISEYTATSYNDSVSPLPSQTGLISDPNNQVMGSQDTPAAAFPKALSPSTGDPILNPSSVPGPAIDGVAKFDLERCRLEMDDTTPLQGEPKGEWITCSLQIVETENKDPCADTRILELFGTGDESKRKIWQLCGKTVYRKIHDPANPNTTIQMTLKDERSTKIQPIRICCKGWKF
ncbi:MAG: hypothetical protein Q9225_004300 [Loekoesia sp. 1 TL-2023]